MTRKYVVIQGEYVSLIAAKYRFSSWRTLFDHPANAEFRAMRPNPNLLYPGDEIVIPEIKSKTVTIQTGQVNKFVLKRPPPDELIVVLRVGGKAVAREECDIEFASANRDSLQQCTARTSDTGELKAKVPRGAIYALVSIKKRPMLRWRLALGYLDPVQDKHRPFDSAHRKVTGIQARLNNLGFFCGKVDGDLGPRTKAALSAFQRRAMNRHSADGTLDVETCNRLELDHGC